MGSPLFIKTQTKKRGCRQEQGGKERLLRRSPPVCLVESVGACVTVCFRREGGVWELTLALNNLIERHPPTPLSRREDRRGCQAPRDPPQPRQQFAVWEAQRQGQRSNKCSETEVLSHDNALTNNSASFQGC